MRSPVPGEAEGITVRPEVLASPDAQTLIGRLNEELTERYPDPRDRSFGLTEVQVGPGQGVFVVARARSEPVGCGALRRIDAVTGEIKRMYVLPAARRTGVGRRVLMELEGHARELGMSRVVLETGDRQQAAIGLYERAGFVRIPCFGEYAGKDVSVCMEKWLA